MGVTNRTLSEYFLNILITWLNHRSSDEGSVQSMQSATNRPQKQVDRAVSNSDTFVNSAATFYPTHIDQGLQATISGPNLAHAAISSDPRGHFIN